MVELLKFAGIAIPILIVLGVLGFVGFSWYKIRYKAARSNQALIISGPKLGVGTNVFQDDEGRSLKIIRGGGHLLRMNQTATPVNLTSFQLKMTTPRVYTHGGVPIVADAVATVTVAGTMKGIAIYAEQFLGKEQNEIELEISEVLGANLRAILSKLSVEDINSNRESFNQQVTEVAQQQLDGMGFLITSLGLTDLRDADPNNGYLDNLGRPIISDARKRAELAEANNDKETRIYIANADKEAQEEEILRRTEIAESQKVRDLKAASIKEETERARAKSEQSYELERTKLSKEVQEESLKVYSYKKEEELRIQQLERERLVILEEAQSKISREKADASYYENTRLAEATSKKQEIEGTAKAKILREMGLAEAEVARETGLAEAEVISKRGIAEAESKRLLAEAISEHGEVVIIEKLIEMLPLYAREIAAPLANIDSVKIVDMGTGDGIASFSKGITNTMVGLQEPLKELTGLDVSQMMKDLVNRGNTHTSVVVPKGTTGVEVATGQAVSAVKEVSDIARVVTEDVEETRDVDNEELFNM